MKKLNWLILTAVMTVSTVPLTVAAVRSFKVTERTVTPDVTSDVGTVIEVLNKRRGSVTNWNTVVLVQVASGVRNVYVKNGVTVKVGDECLLSFETSTFTSNGSSADYDGWMLVKVLK